MLVVECEHKVETAEEFSVAENVVNGEHREAQTNGVESNRVNVNTSTNKYDELGLTESDRDRSKLTRVESK